MIHFIIRYFVIILGVKDDVGEYYIPAFLFADAINFKSNCMYKIFLHKKCFKCLNINKLNCMINPIPIFKLLGTFWNFIQRSKFTDRRVIASATYQTQLHYRHLTLAANLLHHGDSCEGPKFDITYRSVCDFLQIDFTSVLSICRYMHSCA